MIKSLSFKLSFELGLIDSDDVRSMRLPFATSVSVAPLMRFRLVTVAPAERLTELPEINTSSSRVGTPAGLQLAAVDQLPPLAGPTHVFVGPSSSRISPTP